MIAFEAILLKNFYTSYNRWKNILETNKALK